MAVEMGVSELDAAARTASEAGNPVEALRHLMAANRLQPDTQREILIRDLRIAHELPVSGTTSARADNTPVSLSYEQGMPVSSLEEVNADIVRAAFADRGCLYLPNALDSDTVNTLSAAIEGSHNAFRDEVQQASPEWHSVPKMPNRDLAMAVAAARKFAKTSGACLAADSPHAMYLVCDMFERTGITKLANEFIGETPYLSANKFVLWRAEPGEPTEWHQDGRFLGDKTDIVSLNVWTVLTDCGDTAPGMEIVLEYLDHYILNHSGNVFDWTVADSQVDELREKYPVVSPRFKAGDMLLFDHWLLHRTDRTMDMTDTRYAIESWFFAPSVFPVDRAAVIA